MRRAAFIVAWVFALALPALTEFTSPRAWAFGLIGIHEYLRRLGGDSLVNQTRETLTFRLMELLERNSQADWFAFLAILMSIPYLATIYVSLREPLAEPPPDSYTSKW